MENIASYIDHTQLRSDATPQQIKKLCDEAVQYKFASVCVNSCYASLASEQLRGSGVKACCVAGFPLGTMSSAAKAYEAADAAANGADEIDMVINVGQLKCGNIQYVRDDIAAVVKAVPEGTVVKVIIEACLLTDEQKVEACRAAMDAGADFVKTSTGFSTGGATVHDVELMRKTVGDKMGVKAAGGIRDYECAVSMINAGANRIGTSCGPAIAQGSGK